MGVETSLIWKRTVHNRPSLYYLGSTGGANLDVIEEYIKKQRQSKRKYVCKNGLS